MVVARRITTGLALGVCTTVLACGSGDQGASQSSAPGDLVQFLEGPPAGNPEGESCDVPLEAAPASPVLPEHVVGTGSAQSCTATAFIEAVAQGGRVSFDCGAEPVLITLDRPAKIKNDASDDVVIDGSGRVTLSGGGRSRILYMNTCDQAQTWT